MGCGKIFAMHRCPDSGLVMAIPPSIGTPVAKPKRSSSYQSKQAPHIDRTHGTLPTPANDQVSKAPTKKVSLKAQTPAQRFYIRELTAGECPIVVSHGPAGTGKTYIAVCSMVQQFAAPDSPIKKLIFARPKVASGDEDHGFLPGDLNEKLLPWVLPIMDVLHEHFSAVQVERMIQNKEVELAPLGYMRGRTFKNALVLLDEAQNATPAQMKMFLTRIGEGSRLIVTGDVEQHDQEEVHTSGLKDLLRRLAEAENRGDDVSRFAVHGFSMRDCVRHEVIEDVLRMYAG